MEKDFFKDAAKSYEEDIHRVDNRGDIAKLIEKELSFKKDFHIMDFGSGTGLLLERIAPFVGKITAVDVSASMIEMLSEKAPRIDCELDIRQVDLLEESLDMHFDGIISSMTMHHIKDTKKILQNLYSLLKEDAAVALSDLDTEDGTFHTEDTGVHHLGFDREELADLAKSVGFRDVKIQSVGNIIKPTGEFSMFLLTGKR